MRRLRTRTSRTGKRAIQLAGSAIEGLTSAQPASLDLDLLCLFLSSLPVMGGVVFEPVTPGDNGNRLGVVQEMILPVN
jgi:hypothetical protein